VQMPPLLLFCANLAVGLVLTYALAWLLFDRIDRYFVASANRYLTRRAMTLRAA
jgi:hypothetical protein